MEQSTRPLASANAPSDESRLPTTVYRVARSRGSTSLRVLDACVITGAWLLAYIAGYEGRIPGRVMDHMLVLLVLPVVVQLITNEIVGLYGPVWRYASIEEGLRVVLAVAIGTVASVAALAIMATVIDHPLPLMTTPAVAALIMLIGCGGTRFQARLFALERQRVRANEQRIRTLIVGAGSAGVTLSRELSANAQLTTFRLVGFVDDDPRLRGRLVRGLPVFGTTYELARVCRAHNIERILVALPAATREETRAIVDRALETNAQVKVLPRAGDLIDGPLVRSLRDLDLADLLGREQAPVDPVEIADYLEGACVLVTGAGGSIGSEIARQVEQYRPRRLLLLDRDETLLHDVVNGDLAAAETVLANIDDLPRMRRLFDECRPDVVFHAAAHKQVPILERHPAEAVRTNVLATRSLALLAAEYGCGRFVHISTDKAAHPHSVMGATKRAAELVVFDVGRRHDLPFAAVRFGNVLGSRGSVVPTFLRQILEGGPVTVTHPDMTRYFMTIPEAVSLVLQAGAIADEGKIFLIDMGEQVKIVDLAQQMIRLAGLRPGDDVRIEITGVRPGERVHERLHDDSEAVEPTRHPSLRGLAPKQPVDTATLERLLGELDRACGNAAPNDDVVALLERLLLVCGVRCELEVSGHTTPETAAIGEATLAAVPSPEPALDLREPRPAHRDRRRLAVLGGEPSCTPPLLLSRPTRPGLERVARRVASSYDRGVLTNGPLVAELEGRIAERLDVPHVIAVNSCTTGLMLALRALLPDRMLPVVIVPSFTYAEPAHAVAWAGGVPRFAACSATTFQVDPDDVRELIEGAAALVSTHAFGAPCDVDRLGELARRADVPFVLDAADALGATVRGRPLGGFGDAEVFSLAPTTPLVGGEGGLVATRRDDLARALRRGRDHSNAIAGATAEAGDLPGLSARLSELHAATALESLELLDEALDRRRELAAQYTKLLGGIPGIAPQFVCDEDVPACTAYAVAVDEQEYGLSRDQLAVVLATDGIDVRTRFQPRTDELSARVLALPLHTELRDTDVEIVAECVATAHEQAREIDARVDGSELARSRSVALGHAR